MSLNSPGRPRNSRTLCQFMASGHTVKIADENAKQYVKLAKQWAAINLDRDSTSPAGGHPLIRRWFQLRKLAKEIEKDLDRLDRLIESSEDWKLKAALMGDVTVMRTRLLALEKQRTDLLISIQERVDGINKTLLDKAFQYAELARKGAIKPDDGDEPSEAEMELAAINLLQEKGFVIIQDPSQE